jgi:murein DD-endopeptidase MepM/ murein hydrolase activator NlpD
LIKKWTVILIPHNRGERHSFNMSDVHIWVSAASVFVMLCVAAFFFQRSRTMELRSKAVEDEIRTLETLVQTRPVGGPVDVDLDAEWAAREAELRDEFEARDATLLRELSRLYDLEKEVRIITGLPTQIQEGEVVPLPPAEGQGGRPAEFSDGKVFSVDFELLPPDVLNGIASPSADLMLQEMQVRRQSLEHMLMNMDAQRTRIAHTPSVWPTMDKKRRINSGYGNRKDPIDRRLRHHSGVDITADYGATITTTADGVVSFSAYHQYLGRLVKIDHGYGLETWYGHMSKSLVTVGETVKRGQTIGKVGSTGKSTGPHIHYEVHLNGKTVDPKNYIGH